MTEIAETIPLTDQTPLEYDELVALLVANVEHARHVENERLSFNSIHIAVVAGFFALAIDFEKPMLTLLLIGILLIISVIGLLFTKRWSDVFDGHYRKAQEIALLLYGDEPPGEHELLVNKYYYFRHDYDHHRIMKTLRAEQALKRPTTYEQIQARRPNIFKRLWRRLCRIRTQNLFFFFYGIIIAALLCFFVYGVVLLF